MAKAKLKTVLHISLAEFQRWMRSSRLIILAVMLVFIHIQVITTLKDCAAMMGEPVAILEAFVALGNSGVIVLVVPALFLVLMADFPQKSGIDFLYQIRCSKKVWICGQILFALEAVGFTVAFLVVSSAVMMSGSGEWKMEFSHAVTHYSAAFPERTGDYILQLLPENLYQQMTFGAAFAHTVILMILYFLFLAFVLLLAALCNQKYVGILTDVFLIIFGTITCAANAKAMWLFPMAHSISWLHYEKYLKKEIFPMIGSYIYMICGCAGLLIACMIVSRRYQAGKG